MSGALVSRGTSRKWDKSLSITDVEVARLLDHGPIRQLWTVEAAFEAYSKAPKRNSRRVARIRNEVLVDDEFQNGR